MKDDTQTFLLDIAQFCTDSMTWCSQESETSILKIHDILNLLVDEAQRVSTVSQETLQAVQSMHAIINSLAKNQNRELANDLAQALSKLALENDQVQALVAPVIETLQFQDRISQNMQNLSRMMHVWLEKRLELAEKSELTDADKIDFGERLLKCTTMVEERDLIRSKIDGLKEEEKAVSDVMFF